MGYPFLPPSNWQHLQNRGFGQAEANLDPPHVLPHEQVGGIYKTGGAHCPPVYPHHGLGTRPYLDTREPDLSEKMMAAARLQNSWHGKGSWMHILHRHGIVTSMAYLGGFVACQATLRPTLREIFTVTGQFVGSLIQPTYFNFRSLVDQTIIGKMLVPLGGTLPV